MLSRNLKLCREKKGYSKLKLARETGLSARCIEHIEYDKAKNPRVQTLKRICEVLGVSIDELVREEKKTNEL